MSLITRCPACGTMFKVVPDQLKISDGWVRCGHCGEVFDARANLFDPDAPPPPPPAFEPAPFEPAPFEPAPPAAPVDAPAEPFVTASPQTPFDPSPGSHFSDPSADERFPTPAFVAAPDEPSAAGAAVQPDIPIDNEAEWIELDALPMSAPAPLAAPNDRPDEPPVREPVTASHRDDDDQDSELPAEPPPAFVRQADRRAFWRRPAIRFVLLLVFLVFALGLAAQVAYQERDRIVTQWPQTRPVLELLCQPLGCKVGALKRIDAIVVESSSFSRARGDAYKLSILLKNNAALDLAMPSIELTLTDTQDQAIIRRVLSPADMGASDKIAAGVEWNGNIAVSVATQGGADRVSGYRVIAFYP